MLVERTAIGQEIQAVGGNPAAARLAGISVDRIKILGFVISGMCAALTGMLLASRLGSGTTSAADSYLLTAFAAVFLGSATLRDGEFHVLGTFVGTLIIVFGFNGLNIFGAPTFSQYVFQGRHPDRGGRALEPRPHVGGKLKGEERWLQAAIWNFYVMEYARSKNQPWVDLVSGDVSPRASWTCPSLSSCAARRSQRSGRHRFHARRTRAGVRAASSASRLGFRRCGCLRRWTSAPTISPTSSSRTPISTIWARSPNFPRRILYIQKSELLSWYELFALPKRFGHLTAIVDPTTMRAALSASIEHRVTLIDGDKDNVLPGIHVRLGGGHTIGQQFVIVETAAGRRVISGDCIYSRAQITGRDDDGVYIPLNNAVGSAWEQLKMIDKMNDELGGDMGRLVVLHDIERWKGLPVVKEVDGFRIVKIA